MPSPGSIDMGGYDAGGTCASGGCLVTTTLEAMEFGGEHIPLTETLVGPLQNSYTVPSNGDLNPNQGQRIRLSIAPNAGTEPVINVNNEYGYGANSASGYPNGGLVAGQTVQLTDPITSPLGYATTYTWQVETRCAYTPGHPAQTVQGVPVCYGSPGYGASQLPANAQDLTSGCPTACQEDTVFGGNPVMTATGQTISFTWPAPGTYHIRLITKDQYGVVRESSQNMTVVGPAPGLALTTSPGRVGASVVGPVQNGGSVTMSGCIQTPDAAYANPTVTVNWGDGTAPVTETGQSGGSTALSFTFGPTGTCASPWSFTATHTYKVSPPRIRRPDPGAPHPDRRRRLRAFQHVPPVCGGPVPRQAGDHVAGEYDVHGGYPGILQGHGERCADPQPESGVRQAARGLRL
jgi:hypothetical protein